MKTWTYNPTYKKGRTLTMTLVFAGVVLTGWTVFLLVIGDSLPLPY